MARFTIQPGAQFPWHTPGAGDRQCRPVQLVYVQASDCVHRPDGTGTAFVDPGSNVHSAFNPSSTVATVLVATFLDLPADGPLSIADANQNHRAMEGG